MNKLIVIPELLALDWGTSSLRAFLMADGEVLETRQSPHGIQHLPMPGVPGFEKAFAVGVAPFWAATVAKTLLGVVTLPLAWKWIGRIK